MLKNSTFTKGDIVTIKNYPLQFLVVYVNKKNGKVWVSSLGTTIHFYWRVLPKYLTKVGYIGQG